MTTEKSSVSDYGARTTSVVPLVCLLATNATGDEVQADAVSHQRHSVSVVSLMLTI